MEVMDLDLLATIMSKALGRATILIGVQKLRNCSKRKDVKLQMPIALFPLQ